LFTKKIRKRRLDIRKIKEKVKKTRLQKIKKKEIRSRKRRF